MATRHPFKRHQFPAAVILCAVRMYLRYPLSCQDVVDLLAARGLNALVFQRPPQPFDKDVDPLPPVTGGGVPQKAAQTLPLRKAATRITLL